MRSLRALALFVVDNLLSAVVIGPLVVFYWRGTWKLLDVYLFADDKAASGWTCSAVGNVGLVCLVYLQNPLARSVSFNPAGFRAEASPGFAARRGMKRSDKYFKGDTHKYYEIHAVNSVKIIGQYIVTE